MQYKLKIYICFEWKFCARFIPQQQNPRRNGRSNRIIFSLNPNQWARIGWERWLYEIHTEISVQVFFSLFFKKVGVRDGCLLLWIFFPSFLSSILVSFKSIVDCVCCVFWRMYPHIDYFCYFPSFTSSHSFASFSCLDLHSVLLSFFFVLLLVVDVIRRRQVNCAREKKQMLPRLLFMIIGNFTHSFIKLGVIRRLFLFSISMRFESLATF